MAMDFSWLPPGQDANRLPLGMRVNNPGNIKYNPKLGYSGMLGPSSHTDQGDAQMTFDTPQSGMTAAARLAATKYKRGQRSPMALIAGQGGWTPGNRAAAANIAKTMGIGPDDDLGLEDPARMTAFLKALTRQEHGESSGLYGDDVYAAASGGGGGNMPAGSSYLTKALNMAGMIPGQVPAGGPAPIGGAPIAGGPQPLTAPNMRYSKLADALLASAAGAKPKGWGDLLNSAGDLALGYTLSNRDDEEQKAYKGQLAERLLGAGDADTMAKTLMATGDDGLVKQGVALKVAQQKAREPQKPRFHVDEKTGAVWDLNTGKQVTEGKQPKPKLEVADRKEIFEADEGAQAATNVMGSLDKALELNDSAYSGPLAETRGYVSSLFGGEGGVKTEELQNVVLQQVLDNLKATFGAAPTEGERQILVDIQGSVNKAPEVRKRIFEAAKAAAERRLKFNQERAGALRSGDYYNPGYSPAAPLAPAAGGATPQNATPTPGNATGAPQPVSPAPAAPPAPKAIPPKALEMLKGNPTPLARKQFDAIFGPGAADRALRAPAAAAPASAPTADELQSAYGLAP